MSEILVIGHRNPDTDAICSAIGYAEFKRHTGMAEAEAARCGDTNDRIDFVLATFGVAAPRFVPDVSPKVRDVMASEVMSVSPEATIAEALALMEQRNIRVLPILDGARFCSGLVSVFKMSQHFLPAPGQPFDSRRVLASVHNLSRTLAGEMLFVAEPDREQDMVLMIGAMSLDEFRDRLVKFPREKLLVVVGDRENIQRLAIQEKVRAVIVTGGLKVSPGVIKEAERRGVSLLVSPHDTATSAMFCRAATTVKHMAHEEFQVFRDEDVLTTVVRHAAASAFQAFPVFDHNQRVVGMLSKSDFLKKVDRRLILVDHNELSQAVRGADSVEIIEIIDHHRIGTLATQQPILFRNEPVGSTSTIVADCFFRENVTLPKSIAGLLLAGVVSDTLNLTSPTTTERDVEVLGRLEKIAGVNATRFTEKLFASGSVLISKPPRQAITADCKEYQEKDRHFSVAQIEEIGFDQFWKRKDEVFGALEHFRRKDNHLFSALLVTDIVRQSSLLALAADEDFLRQINYPELEPGLYELNGVVSRKKQLLPYLTHCLQQVEDEPPP